MTRQDQIAEATRLLNDEAIVNHAKEKLDKAKEKMKLLKQYKKQGSENWEVKDSWVPEIVLSPKGSGYYDRAVTIKVTIPYGVVEQSLVYEMEDARREIIKHGGLA